MTTKWAIPDSHCVSPNESLDVIYSFPFLFLSFVCSSLSLSFFFFLCVFFFFFFFCLFVLEGGVVFVCLFVCFCLCFLFVNKRFLTYPARHTEDCLELRDRKVPFVLYDGIKTSHLTRSAANLFLTFVLSSSGPMGYGGQKSGGCLASYTHRETR